MKFFTPFLSSIILLSVILSSNGVNAQLVINSVDVIPANPTSNDTIYVITDLTSLSSANLIDHQVYDFGDTVLIEDCYYVSAGAEAPNFVDTINIGLKSPGSYVLIFNAYKSNVPGPCNYSDTTNASMTFTVSTVGLTELQIDSKELVRIVDIWGRENEKKPNTTLFYIYKDGSVKKIYIIED